MQEMDRLNFKSKLNIKNQPPTTYQPNYNSENLQQNVPILLYIILITLLLLSIQHFSIPSHRLSPQPSSFSYP